MGINTIPQPPGQKGKCVQHTLIRYVNFLVDNIFIKVGDHILHKTQSNEDVLRTISHKSLSLRFRVLLGESYIFFARKFTNSFRYIEDLLSFNNFKLVHRCEHQIYSKDLTRTTLFGIFALSWTSTCVSLIIVNYMIKRIFSSS